MIHYGPSIRRVISEAREDRMATDRFAFGENWAGFVGTALTQQRIVEATDALKALLDVQDLHGESFLDIGSGSGLHSLAAYRLGAASIVSFDYDINSVQSTERVRSSVGDPKNWQVFQGSILDDTLVATHQASIVYSWGVLHHTGQMWQAIRNAARMVKPGGLFCIAIYNKVDRWLLGGNSAIWLRIKRSYVRSPAWRQRLIISSYKTHFFLYKLLREGKNPVREIRAYGELGMDWHTDVVDWVGGYPFEYASTTEMTAFCEKTLGLQTVRLIPKKGHYCSEYVFRMPTQ